jgi:undecaprenyl phosphate-alpha-L-ara4N flippase subunit ArnE
VEQYKYSLLALAILLSAGGQLLLKQGTIQAGGATALFLSPWTLGGLCIYFLSAMTYILALRYIPLSVAYPSVAASYFLIVIAANLIWHEPITWQSFGGIALIASGIFLLHRG